MSFLQEKKPIAPPPASHTAAVRCYHQSVSRFSLERAPLLLSSTLAFHKSDVIAHTRTHTISQVSYVGLRSVFPVVLEASEGSCVGRLDRGPHEGGRIRRVGSRARQGEEKEVLLMIDEKVRCCCCCCCSKVVVPRGTCAPLPPPIPVECFPSVREPCLATPTPPSTKPPDKLDTRTAVKTRPWLHPRMPHR